MFDFYEKHFGPVASFRDDVSEICDEYANNLLDLRLVEGRNLRDGIAKRLAVHDRFLEALSYDVEDIPRELFAEFQSFTDAASYLDGVASARWAEIPEKVRVGRQMLPYVTTPKNAQPAIRQTQKAARDMKLEVCGEIPSLVWPMA